jgi:formylglycine-generating enzyme required for sulfatase activity
MTSAISIGIKQMKPIDRNSSPIHLFAIVLITAAISTGCKPKTPESTTEKSHRTAPVVLPFGVKTATLLIDNPDRLPATLHRIDFNESIKVEDLNVVDENNSTDSTFNVPSGIYTIRTNSNSAFPAPAIARVLGDQSIQIQIRKFPASETGWCWIPSGPAVIGDTIGVGAEDERPARIIDVEAFWLAETEVTNKEYARFLSSKRNVEPRWIDLDSRKCRIQKSKNGFASDAPDLPVVMVSLYGAQAYCQWLSEKTGDHCRLPTEIEWEKAARGPESFIYSYGNVYKQSLANQESGKLKPVKSYQPNGFGLYDMTGNAFEWMSNLNDPSDSERIMNQALRGGSFVLDGMYLRNSFRMRQSKSVMTDDIGFRIAKDAKNDN